MAVLPQLTTAGAASPVQAADDDRPNILLVTADDMTLDELAYMPRTRRLLAARGATYEEFLAPHPICCPSRAQLLTGQYAHNNGVFHNEGEFGGYKALREPGNTLAPWLSSAGYQTGVVGKWLNGWRPNHQAQPPGWDHFEVLLKPFRPARYPVYRDGERFRQKEHSPDYVARRTTAMINEFAANDEPFFIWSSQVPPHKMWDGPDFGPPVPAERHASLFADAKAPSVKRPSFNESDLSDKPPYLADEPTHSRREINQWYRQRIRSLQAVDEGVAAAVRALRAAGEMGNTYVLFTSDNGYQLGEHRLLLKNFPYEESLRVPLVARGPGLEAGSVVEETRSMIDLAPTFVELSGATPGRVMDGRSLLEPARPETTMSAPVLIQAGALYERWWWRGVRTERYTYVEYQTSGFVELYDRQTDPFQLDNVAGDPKYAEVQADLRAEYQRLRDCAGRTCSGGST